MCHQGKTAVFRGVRNRSFARIRCRHAKKVYFGAMFIERRGDKKGEIGIKRGQIIKKKA